MRQAVLPPRESPVLVADDHDLFRSGLAAILHGSFKFAEVIQVDCFDAAIAVLRQRPEIKLVTLDPVMPGVDGALSLQGIRQTFPDVRLVVLTGSVSRASILAALAAGVHGYVPKTFGISQIALALQRILDGEIYVPPEITQLGTRDEVVPSPEVAPLAAATAGLTPRQRSVLAGIAEGKSNKEIARVLGLTESTVKVHVHALFRALAVHNRTSAAAIIHARRTPTSNGAPLP